MDKTECAERVTFHDELQVMEVDFSNVTFEDARQVNDFYDVIDEKIAATGQDWYFLVNYFNCQLTQWAWLPFARRGKLVNLAHSLGTARYDVDEATAKTILEKSEQESFDANLFATRDSALAKIDEMKQAAQ